MRFATLMVAACLGGCPGKSTEVAAPKPIDDAPLRIRIAQAEARRGEGIAELVELTKQRDKPTRLLALRGLGRVGGTKPVTELGVALGDPDPEIVGGAAAAIGVSTSLDDEHANQSPLTTVLVQALARARERRGAAFDPTPQIIEAIGRAASASAQETIVPYLLERPELAAATAIALARYGRRKIELIPVGRERLIEATHHGDGRVRYAAAHALAREQLPKSEDAGEKARQAAAAAALAARLSDADANVRAQAAQALARRKAVVEHRRPLSVALYDADWRVAVEAMRALAGPASDRMGRHQAALALMFWLWSIDGGKSGERFTTSYQDEAVRHGKEATEALIGVVREQVDTRTAAGLVPGPSAPSGAHVIVEGLRALQPERGDPLIGSMMVAITTRAHASESLPPQTRGWVECLALAAWVRGAEKPDYAAILDGKRCRLPDHLRLPLAAELVAAKVGSVDQRRAVVKPLLDHADARVRVSGMTALASMWADGNELDHRAVVAMTIAALGSKDGLIAGTAVENATTLYAGIDKDKPVELKDALDAAIVSRAQAETDPELAAALLATIAERKMAAGAGGCRAALRGAPVLVKAAVDCLKALGQPVEPPPIGPGTAPPVEVATVIGQSLTWKLVTTRGEIEIELRPDIAPWAVATVVRLTREGYYDGLEMHRVVPNFVAQGGDPTQSGWGGPGFAIPAEPSSGSGYVEGGVGMADAGRDSAGSQWFIMHAPAPHLDGRYTWIGRVVSGQRAADSLLIGDKVVRATVVAGNRP